MVCIKTDIILFISFVVGIEAAMKGNDSYFQDLNRKWERVAPICFGYERDTERSKMISREIRKFYFNGEPISLNNAPTLAKVSVIVTFNAIECMKNAL